MHGQTAQDKSADFFRIEHYRKKITVWPLFGLERLVKIRRRKQNGVLLCDSIMSLDTELTFSNSNRRTDRYTAEFFASDPAFLGEPRINAPNEASDEAMRRFHDDGREFTFCFAPQNGKTYTVACDFYRPFEPKFGGARLRLDNKAHVENYELTVDISAYASAGYSIESPRCEFDPAANFDPRAGVTETSGRRLVAHRQGPGCWQWRLKNVQGGMLRLGWVVYDTDPSRICHAASFDRLATELSIDPRVTKDLHNFVSICHYFAADYRSLNAIALKMVTGKSVLSRSLESIERLVGTQLVERTKGKGLIEITPVGEAVLEWWSRFYTRWTPIAPDLAGAE